jgi:hypothetical protein
MAGVKRRYDMYKVQELFRGVVFKDHGPFESKELAEMFVGHHDLNEPGVEYIIFEVE